MNIQCKWNGDVLTFSSGLTPIGYVIMEEEPVLVINDDVNSSLTFTEIEHIMDCWHNMPKENKKSLD